MLVNVECWMLNRGCVLLVIKPIAGVALLITSSSNRRCGGLIHDQSCDTRVTKQIARWNQCYFQQRGHYPFPVHISLENERGQLVVLVRALTHMTYDALQWLQHAYCFEICPKDAFLNYICIFSGSHFIFAKTLGLTV